MGYVTIDEETIRGTVLEVLAPAFDFAAQLTHYWGSEGVSELLGQRGTRLIRVHMIVHDAFDTDGKLIQELARIQNLIRRHGRLRIFTGVYLETHDNCTFLGFWPDEGPGTGPLQDVSGTLDPLPQGNTGGWWRQGVLVFRQIKPGGVDG